MMTGLSKTSLTADSVREVGRGISLDRGEGGGLKVEFAWQRRLVESIEDSLPCPVDLGKGQSSGWVNK